MSIFFYEFLVLLCYNIREGDRKAVNMTVRETLAKNLAHYREQAGYTQKSASVALRTKPTTISSWERGVSQPSADMLVEVAILYRVPLSCLCGMDYDIKVTGEEMELIKAFRSADEFDRMTVLRTLGIK